MTKIAFATDDGQTISAHLGRAQYFNVAQINNDGTMQFEQRPKWHHGLQEGEPHNHEQGHDSMFAAIRDCQVLVAGGMGEPAYQSAVEQGLQVILTGEKEISTALASFRSGSLQSDSRRIHMHR